MLVDAHCHAYALSEEGLREYHSMIIICVSEDLESSRRAIALSEAFPNIIPFVGLHPWNVAEASREELDGILELMDREDVMGIGEVGLDKRRGRLYDRQLEFFRRFCEASREYGLPMNIHALDSWREVLELLRRYDVESAVLHWYSGPLDLLEELRELGFLITINPAAKIQEKHRRVLEGAELEMILTESDGPYQYRGLDLKPGMIPELVRLIAEVKGVDARDVEDIVESNLRRFLR